MSSMTEVVIAGSVRTPVGDFGGSLRSVPAYDLCTLVIQEAVKRAGLTPGLIEAVIMGQNYQSGEYVNIARMSLLKAGWPVEITGLTLDRRCPSGFDAVCLASMMIQSGSAQIAVAGGVESMSTAELYLPGGIRWGMGGSGDMPRGQGSLAAGGLPLYDRILRARQMSQPEERFGSLPSMMTWAETAARECGVTREEADAWALLGHRRACAAIQSGAFAGEIVPVPLPQRKGEALLFGEDEHPRRDTSPEALARLRPVIGGVCTAGNSAAQSDGAGACVVMSAEKAREHAVRPVARLRAFAFSGVDPRQSWKAVPAAVHTVLGKAGLTLAQMDLIELHEAFATQVLANFQELGLTEKDYDRVNVHGSCIALGHPLGATGARILATLVHEMGRRGVRYGLLAICGGGGMGVAGILERV